MLSNVEEDLYQLVCPLLIVSFLCSWEINFPFHRRLLGNIFWEKKSVSIVFCLVLM